MYYGAVHKFHRVNGGQICATLIEWNGCYGSHVGVLRITVCANEIGDIDGLSYGGMPLARPWHLTIMPLVV